MTSQTSEKILFCLSLADSSYNVKKYKIRYNKDHSLGDAPPFDLFVMTGLPDLVENQRVGNVIRKDGTGPDPEVNAYKFRKPLDDLELVASAPQFRLFTQSLSRSMEFVFAASIKQDKKNRGTIMSITSKSPWKTNFPNTMALVSDSRRNIFVLYYRSAGNERKALFKSVGIVSKPYRKSWRSVVLGIRGSTATLFVDCHEIGSVELESIFYVSLNANQTKLTLASAYKPQLGRWLEDFKVKY